MKNQPSRFFRLRHRIVPMLAFLLAASLYGEDCGVGIVPVVLPFYTPDTSGGAGFYVIFYSRGEDGRASKQPDDLALYGSYTLKNQASFGGEYNFHLKDLPVNLTGQAEVSSSPSKFWGIGPGASEDAEESYSSSNLILKPSFLVRLSDRVSLGPMIDYKYIRIRGTDRGGLLESGSVPGAEGTTIFGGGLRLTVDFRDSAYYPQSGGYFDVQATTHRTEIGSSENFTLLDIDGRYFIGFGEDRVLAFQTLLTLSGGNVPFEAMNGLGGSNMLRGLLGSRYLDRNQAAGQAEYRFPLFWRFAGVVFGGLGTVADEPGKLCSEDVKPTWGFGLRYIVDRAEHIAFRLDFGFDEKNRLSCYFLVKEAF